MSSTIPPPQYYNLWKTVLLTMAVIADLTAQALDIEREKLLSGDLSFALGRLEELGLVEWSD